MTAALAEAAKTFEQTLGELGITGNEREVNPSALGRRAALLAASDVVWHKHLGPMYSSKQVREVMGRGTRQSVSDPAQRELGVVLFGDAGEQSFPVRRTEPVPASVIEAARQRFGLIVAPTPG